MANRQGVPLTAASLQLELFAQLLGLARASASWLRMPVGGRD